MLGNDHGHGNQIQRKLTEHSKTETPESRPLTGCVLRLYRYFSTVAEMRLFCFGGETYGTFGNYESKSGRYRRTAGMTERVIL